ncbi:MAG: response regulator [Chthoniobacteraceae bacterium]
MNAPTRNEFANHRILVIDDNPAIHEDFRKILDPGDVHLAEELEADEAVLFGDAPKTAQQADFEIDSAMQGQDGLKMVEAALAEGRPYATAFVDVRMPPGWDGVETIQHLWKADPELQVVICTAYSDFSWEEITGKLGATDKLLILKKPFDNVEVLQFAHALTEKWLLGRRACLRMEELDALVRERTASLQAANEKLSLEVQERILIEAALRVSEHRFAKAFNASPIAMAIVSRADFRFVDANESFSRLLGWSREAVLADNLATLPMWDDLGVLTDLLGRMRGNLSVTGVACGMRTRSGELREASVIAEDFDLDGVPHALLLIEDVTERKKMEERLRQSQKMEAIGQLAAGVAHDFNNILTVIRGHVSLQLAGTHLQGSHRASLAQVLAASERASSLTRQLLSFSRRQVAQPRALQLHQVIEQVADMLRRLLGEHVALEVACAADLPAIIGDAGNVELVLMNLAVNARDAMPGGGTLRIEASPVNFGRSECAGFPERRRGRFMRLSVSDTGCGMPPEVLARVFEPFFTTKEVGKGTGLGLATVYGIARQHDGWIEVKSEPGLGTTFDVLFPCSTGAIEEPAAPEIESQPTIGGTETILAAEDEPDLRELVQVVLESAGYRVLLAASGPEALALFEEHRGEVDLLITDMMMPGGITGRDLATQLQARQPDLRVVFTSGYSSDLMGESAPSADEINFLQKPYDPDTLLRVVRTSLSACAVGAC